MFKLWYVLSFVAFIQHSCSFSFPSPLTQIAHGRRFHQSPFYPTLRCSDISKFKLSSSQQNFANVDTFVLFTCKNDGRLVDVLQKQGGLSKSASLDVINLGAVHVRKLLHQKILLPWSRRIEDGLVRKGSIVKFFTNPRRFESCNVVWHKRVLFEDDKFLVLDKPAWLPFQPTLDNFHECLIKCVLKNLKFPPSSEPTKLLGLHRLDMCCSGTIALAKTKEAAVEFHELLRAHENQLIDASAMQKTYLTLTTAPVSIGQLSHWMWPETLRKQLLEGAPPSLLSEGEMRGFKPCVLEVLSCTPCSQTALDQGGQSATSAMAPSDAERWYESEVRLLTGRRHQIRVQLAAVGAPLVGDCLYGPMAGLIMDRDYPALLAAVHSSSDSSAASADCEPLSQMARGWEDGLGEQARRELAALRDCVRTCRPAEPESGAVGLHAWRLSFLGRHARAGPPWWRAGVGPDQRLAGRPGPSMGGL